MKKCWAIACAMALVWGVVGVANFDKWAQPTMGHRGRNGGTVARPRPVPTPKTPTTTNSRQLQSMQRLLNEQVPGGNQSQSQQGQSQFSPFQVIGQAMRATPGQVQSRAPGPWGQFGTANGAGMGSMSSLAQRVQAAMGRFVDVAAVNAGSGSWSGGPLGRVPNHHGWAGLKPNVKTWALRILGAFPQLRFSSGFRTPAQNAAAGGVANSGHMRGDKIDLSGDRRSLAAAADWARRHGARVLLHDAGNGYHLDLSWAGVAA